MNNDVEYIVAVIGLTLLAAAAGWLHAIWNGRRAPAHLHETDLPSLLPANAPLVSILRTVAEDVEASGRQVADGLRDVARVIQVAATEPVGEHLRERMAGIVDEHASVLKRGSQRIREG